MQQYLPLEEIMWKTIQGFENYEINNQGKVRNKSSGKTLKDTLSWNGYRRISLSGGKRGSKKGFMIHRLVAEYFIPNPNNLPEVNHKNLIKSDNRVENLEWCSKLENMQHAKEAGVLVIKRGEENNTSKLSNRDIDKIRNSTIRYQDLADLYGVCVRTIVRVKKKESWKHLN